MPKIELPLSEGLYPLPVVLVSCLDKSTGKPNIITIAWCGVVCSNPPQISISIRPERFTFELIKKTGDYVVNVPSEKILKLVDACGVRSGRATDKFKLCGFTPSPSSKISSPGIAQCPVNIECKLKNVLELGSHHMFIGEVVAVMADNGIADNEGRIDFASAGPIVFNRREYWNLGKKLGYYGFSEK